MIIRRYEAESFEKAYSQVRRDLGPDAMIIQTNEKKAPGILAFILGRKVVEVVAGKPVGTRRLTPPPKRPSGVWTRLTAGDGATPPAVQRVREPAAEKPDPAPPAAPVEADEDVGGRLAEIQVLKNDMRELKSLVKTLIKARPAEASPQASSTPLASPPASAPAPRPAPSADEARPAVQGQGTAPEAVVTKSTAPAKAAASAKVPPSKSVETAEAAPKTGGTVSGSSPAIDEVCRHLAEHELDPEILGALRRFLEENLTERDRLEGHLVREKAVEYLAGMLKVSGGIRLRKDESTRLVALIGPTGVGKTTTVAKLAAGLKYNARLDTAFVTIDTFRLGAPEQLKKYAEIIDVPLKIVFKPEDMKSAIEALGDRQVVLIDTVGRSGKSRTDVEELRRFLCGDLPIERHLLLSATTKLSDMARILENFGEVGFDSVIVTKLDETESYGSVLSCLARTKETPLSFVTTGQGVPEDIQVADPARMARLMFANPMGATRPPTPAGSAETLS